MKESIKKTKSVPSQTGQAPQSTVGTEIPNSVYLGIMGGGASKGVDGFEEKMMARMQQFRDNQRAGAEKEADSIAAGIDPNASMSEVKSRLGERLGADFSGVRIHTDASARDRADSIGAEAYTQGKDVYFGSEGVNAQTVAHELVHTVQQGEIAGTGVTESAPAGNVQMKPGKFARLKHWFKKKLGLAKAPEPDAPTVEVPSSKAYKGEFGSTNLFNNMIATKKLDKMEYYQDSDSHQAADVVDAGEYDSHFAQLEHADKVHELQRLAVYLSAKRAKNENDFDENDKKLQQTYYSVLQQSSGNRDFLIEMMKQAGSSGRSIAEKFKASRDEEDAAIKQWDAANPFMNEQVEDPVKKEEAKKYNDARYKNRRALASGYELDRFKNIHDSEEGLKFAALRFMMSDAANLMTDGNNRNWFNEKRRMHFSKKYDKQGELVRDDRDIVHEGQTKYLNEDGSISKSFAAQFVSDINDGQNYFSQANRATASLSEEGQEHSRAFRKKIIDSYRLPGMR